MKTIKKKLGDVTVKEIVECCKIDGAIVVKDGFSSFSDFDNNFGGYVYEDDLDQEIEIKVEE